jgi:hypothetical protein
VWANEPPHGGFPAFQDEWTLPVWLGAGYETMWVGKYLNGYGGRFATPDVTSRPLIASASLAELRQDQLESLLAVDDAIDGMLDALDETGELYEMLVLFTSDNGHAGRAPLDAQVRSVRGSRSVSHSSSATTGSATPRGQWAGSR